MNKFYKYSSIPQLRSFIKDAGYLGLNLCTLTGTVKVHGTNASVVITPEGDSYPQSRSRIISLEEDNHGFAQWHSTKKEVFSDYAEFLKSVYPLTENTTIIVYGEWAGSKLQSGAAVCSLERFFYVFGVKLVTDNESIWVVEPPKISNDSDIVMAHLIWHKTITFDSSNLNKFCDEITQLVKEVEEECPVAKYFGVSGTGEGIVWQYYDRKNRLIFKTKGEKHKISKTKRVVEVDTMKVTSIDKFVEYAVTENRLKQALEEVGDEDFGDFIKWVFNDIKKEELDVLEDNCLTIKDVSKSIAVKARNWFQNVRFKF